MTHATQKRLLQVWAIAISLNTQPNGVKYVNVNGKLPPGGNITHVSSGALQLAPSGNSRRASVFVLLIISRVQ
jgi:hypothetical protein